MEAIYMEIIENLKKELIEMNAGVCHVTMENIGKKEGFSAVISVYDNQKPAHMVLSELYAWAEQNNQEVKELIEKIEQDMSWNSRVR
jgi:hypothetical protein